MTQLGQRKRWAVDGRLIRRHLVAKSTRRDDGCIEVRSPGVGLWRHAPAPGSLLMPGAHLGELEVLDVLYELFVDDHSHGLVMGEPPGARRARIPLGHGEIMLVLDPRAGAVIEAEAEAELGPATSGLTFRAPSSGRFYRRAAPDKPSFVDEGSVVEEGMTLCLLEVMKTFHRISFGGIELPRRAKVTRIVPVDGADVEVGDVLFELEKS